MSGFPPVPASNKLPAPSGTPVIGDVPEVSGTSPLQLEWSAGGGGGSGTVTSVTATDTSIVVSGTDTIAPTLATGTLDVIATQHPPAASWSNNGQNITSVANGVGAQDAAAFGQIPTSAGTIGGALKANNLSDLANESTARTNLGLGAVATEAYVSGQYLCAPSVYAPSSATSLSIASATLGAFTSAASTVAAGSNGGEISTIATWATPSAGVLAVANGTLFPSTGGTFTVATSTTTATCTYTGVSGNTLTGCAYVSGSATGTVSTGGAVTLTTSAFTTGTFTAPSTSVVVTASCVVTTGTGSILYSFALAAHSTVTPILGFAITKEDSATANHPTLTLVFVVTGLTPSNSYSFDLLGAMASADTLTVVALGTQSTTPTGALGGPVIMTVQAV